MNIGISRLTALFVTVSLLSALSIARAQTTTPPCVIGYTVGFFNGVWNTELQAIDGRNALQAAFREASGRTDDTYNHEDVSYQLFYNHTGSTVGSSGLQDIAEVFEQRAKELDPSGDLLNNHFYLFWEPFNGNSAGYSQYVGSASKPLLDFIQGFQNSVVSSSLTTLASIFNYVTGTPTNTDYSTQNTQLDALAAAGRKFVLVAHSQGNLFVNQAYDHIMPAVGATRVKVVHIAPASPTLRGQYELANIDLVINGLRLATGFGTIADVNLTLVPSSSDPSGHTLVGTYLDGTRPGRAQTELLLTNAFSALPASTCAVSLTPNAVTPQLGDSVTFNAKLNPAPTDPGIQVSYGWAVTGTAGGTLQTSSGNAPTAATLTPTITYIAPATAPQGAIDTVTVSAYAGAALADPANDEKLGDGTATVTLNSGGIVNGSFSNGLSGWTFSGTPGTTVSLFTSEYYNDQHCFPAQEGNPFAALLIGGSNNNAAISQTFTVPMGVTTLSLRSWVNLDPVTAQISVTVNGTTTVLDTFRPPSMQALSDPNNYYSVVCTGAAAVTRSIPFGDYAGKTVTLNVGGIGINYVINGYFLDFDDVTLQ
jgi:hypothetical protein